MSNPVQVEVVLSNSERLPVVDVWLVIDVLRASTVIVRWFEAGGGELYPVGSVEDAKLLAEHLKQEGKNPILMGERNAIAPQGFDLGNSPLEITKELVQKNPCAVMSTTNGTAALLKAASTGAPVLAACARNAPAALSEALARGRRIGILCSGRKGRPAWDDTLCAGLLVAYLTERFTDVHLADNARLALLAWASSKDFKASMLSADHAVFLDRIGFGDDIAFASESGVTQTVPELFELPGGDGTLAVLRLAAENAPKGREYDWRLPYHGGISSSGILGREEPQYTARPQEDPPPSDGKPAIDKPTPSKPASDIVNVFFAAQRQKNKKSHRRTF